jgi:hypothetical protein
MVEYRLDLAYRTARMSSLHQVQRLGGEFLVFLLAAPAAEQHSYPGGTHPSHDRPLAPQHHPQVRNSESSP